MHRPSVVATGGWCAPSDITYLELFEDGLRPEVWPTGLLAEDIDWLARMVHVAEVDPEPLVGMLELPQVSVKRGGIRFE